MTLFLTAILLGIAVRWVLFRRLVMPRIVMPWLFFAALGWEAAWAFLSLRGWFSPQVAGPVGQMGTYALLMLAFAANIRLVAFWPALLGAAMNGLVIFANGGHMPVDLSALERAGLGHYRPFIEGARDSLHIPMGPDTALRFLGDWIAIPGRVISPGDILLALSMFLLPVFPFPLARLNWARGQGPHP